MKKQNEHYKKARFIDEKFVDKLRYSWHFGPSTETRGSAFSQSIKILPTEQLCLEDYRHCCQRTGHRHRAMANLYRLTVLPMDLFVSSRSRNLTTVCPSVIAGTCYQQNDMSTISSIHCRRTFSSGNPESTCSGNPKSICAVVPTTRTCPSVI